MDTLTHEEIKELQEHQAIPYGGWKLAVGITAHLWCILCAWALSRYATTQLEQVTTVSWAYLTGGGIFTIAIGLMNGALFLLQRAWLTQFRRRNIRGYVARFYRSSSSERPLQHTITTPRENQNLARTMSGADVGTGAFAIGLLLNGRLAQIMSTNRNAISRLKGWSVRFRAILDTGAVMVEIRKRNSFWAIDERIVTDIGSALAWLEEIATQPCAPTNISELIRWKTTQFKHAFREREALERQNKTLFGILNDAAENPRIDLPTTLVTVPVSIAHQVRLIIAERDGVRSEMNRCTRELTEVFRLVDGLAREIESNNRLHTVGGLRLLGRMLDWLCGTALQGSPEHRALQNRLAVVEQKLIEKEQKDRRRHGKQPTVTTG